MSDKRNNPEKELPLVTGHLSLVTVLEITDVIDLHTFSPREIPAVVETYLEEARAKGFETVRIIHGRGKGVQRARVQSVLSRTPFVASFQDAPMGAGGWGATIVWLRSKDS
ncbi:MAG: Smr/MutS family protein [Terriglobia bacterium]